MTTKAVATVLGGFWEQNLVPTLSSMSGKGPNRRLIAMSLDAKGLLGMRKIMSTLDGVVPGSLASLTRARVQASDELGGARVIETETLVNRVTTAADVTEIEADFHTLSTRTFTPSPVANGDQNPLGTR
jgi:hypothetical protein